VRRVLISEPSDRFDFSQGSMYTHRVPRGGAVAPMALLTLHVDDIAEEGLSLACQVEAEELTLSPTDAQVRDGFSLAAEIARVGTSVNVTGVLAGTFLRQCVRCLKDYEDPVRLPFAVEYRHQEMPTMRRAKLPTGGSRQAPQEPDEEVKQDVYLYAGDQLDLATMLREHVILATPMQPLCDAACLGLCPACGQDRNEGLCRCSEESRSFPFTTLRGRGDHSGGASKA
jgi:uncharacterized protein